MNCEGPILSLQPGGVVHPVTSPPELDLSQSPGTISSLILSPVNVGSAVAADMASLGRTHLGIHSKVRSSSIADCKSAPNSPPLSLLANKVNVWKSARDSDIALISCFQEFRASSKTLTPTGNSHTVPRVPRASSAEPDAGPNLSHSLTISSPKIPLASRMRRQPTIDTSSFTREEFEVCCLSGTPLLRPLHHRHVRSSDIVLIIHAGLYQS